MGFPGGSEGKESTCNARDLGLIPRLGKCPGNSYILQYSGLENSMDRGALARYSHGVAKSRTRLSDFHFHFKWKHFYIFKPWHHCKYHCFLFLSQRLSMKLMFFQFLEIFSMFLTLHKIESQVSSLILQDLHKNQLKHKNKVFIHFHWIFFNHF